MAMSPEAKAEYEKALIAVVLKHGSMVAEDASYYRWVDYRYHGNFASSRKPLHHVTCGWASIGKPVEDYWNEFQGTFYEGDDSVHGIVLKGLTCNCGQIQNREFRWTANMSEVAEAVFEEAFGKKAEESAEEEEPAKKKRACGNFDDDVETTPGGVPWNYN